MKLPGCGPTPWHSRVPGTSAWGAARSRGCAGSKGQAGMRPLAAAPRCPSPAQLSPFSPSGACTNVKDHAGLQTKHCTAPCEFGQPELLIYLFILKSRFCSHHLPGAEVPFCFQTSEAATPPPSFPPPQPPGRAGREGSLRGTGISNTW